LEGEPKVAAQDERHNVSEMTVAEVEDDFHRQSVRVTNPCLSKSALVTLGLVLSLAVMHSVMVCGYTTVFWGDYGLWVHQVERFACGESLYKDFYFSAPPPWDLGDRLDREAFRH
jgi:hypothetical protein